jgi:hypothetical protein
VSISTKRTRILPIRYNYSTNVIWVWRADDSDITALPAGPFFIEKLQNMQAEASKYTELDKTFLLASAKDVAISNGGPGKLYIAINHLCRSTSILGLE